MTETFALLLLAHVLADFVAQPAAMARAKHRPQVLLAHGLIVGALSTAAVGQFSPWIAALTVAHVLTDLAKALHVHRLAGQDRSEGALPFLADQTVHLLTLAAVAMLAPGLYEDGFWPTLALPFDLPQTAALVAGAVFAVRAGGFAVGLLMARYPLGADDDPGLPGGGEMIGILERGMIYLLLLAGEPGAIGFLVAAKSILRFGTVSKDRASSEYVIVGTLASFGWALAAGLAALELASRV